MQKLEEYILVDNETQKHNWAGTEYETEIYGCSQGGVLFERDLTDLKQILYHVSNGLKTIGDYLDNEDTFFRKGNDTFYRHYRDCEDYNYSKEPIVLSKEEIVEVIKEYVYLHQPRLMESTLMGWDTSLGVLHNPNHCNAYVRLDDGKNYVIYKCTDKVEIQVCLDNAKGKAKSNLEPIAEFLLEEVMYEKALDFMTLKRTIYHDFFGKMADSKIEQYLSLKHELETLLLKETENKE